MSASLSARLGVAADALLARVKHGGLAMTMSTGTAATTQVLWTSALTAFALHLARDLGRAETTVALRRYHLRRLARWVDVGPGEVTTTQLLDWLALREWRPETRKSQQASLRIFWGWATRSGLTTHDPTRELPTVSVPRALPRPVPDEVIVSSLSEAARRERAMVLLGAEMALRAREIAVVSANDLWGSSLLVHGKGGRQRMVPVVDGWLLNEIRQAQRHPGGYLFPGRIDGHLSRGYVSRLLSRTLPGAYTGHQLRHRAATTAYDATGDLRAVQEMLGHASSRTTEIYTLVSARKLRAVADAAALGLP